MAIADYKLCDVCQGKAFYDANISDPNYTSTWDEDEEWDRVELAVLCSRCKKTHKITIVPISELKGQDR